MLFNCSADFIHLNLLGVMLCTRTCESAVPYASKLESSDISTPVMLEKKKKKGPMKSFATKQK